MLNSPVYPSSVSEIRSRLEKLEREKNVTNYEREKGVPPKSVKLTDKNGKDENADERNSAERDGDKNVTENSVDDKIMHQTAAENGDSAMQHQSGVIKSWVLSESTDSGVSDNGDSNRSSSHISVNDSENTTPPPLPPLPPPRKPVRTFLHDLYTSSATVDEKILYPPVLFLSKCEDNFSRSEDYAAMVRFFGPSPHSSEDIYEEILPKECTYLKRECSQEEVGSDWSGSEQSFQLDENKNFVEERKRYLELARSRSTLDKTSNLDFRKTLVESKLDDDRLCEAAFLLGLTCKDSVLIAEVQLKVPDDFVIDEGIRKMCFPDAQSWKSSGVVQDYYTVVFTRENGDRYYAHCHRVKVEGSDTIIPYSYCVISKHRFTALFKEILLEVTKWHGLPKDEKMHLLSDLCTIRVPPPGGTVSLKGLTFKRPFDWWRFGEIGLDFLYQRFSGKEGVKILVNLFSTLLLERKVILVGRSISEVSTAVQGLKTMLFPLVWAYNLISILPADMVHITESPAPYIMGLLTGEDIDILPPDAGMIVNIDSATVLFATGDEATILPKCVRNGLRTRLKGVKYRLEPGDSPVLMALLSEAFLLTMVDLFGHYKESLVRKEDGNFVFDRDKFVQSHPVEECSRFLQWFADTEMFYNFIAKRCNLLWSGSPIDGPLERKFLQRSMEHFESSALYVPKKNMVVKRKLEKFAGMFKEKFSGSS